MTATVTEIRKKVLYTVGTAAALTGVVFLAIGIVHSARKQVSNTSTLTLRNSDPQRDTFEQLYELGWRADGNAGNTVVEAVYEYPQLQQALSSYAKRSAIQAETLRFLQSSDMQKLVPFLLTFQRNEAFPRDFIVGDHVRLTDDRGIAYPFDHWDVSAFPSGMDTIFAGVAWFKRPASSTAAKRLEMAVTDVPGNTKATSFGWQLDILGLLPLDTNATP